MTAPDDLPAAAPEENRQPAAVFTIDGAIASMATQPGQARHGQCKCCRPRGHVFWYGIRLPFQVPGTNGPGPAQPHDWLYRLLYPYRFDDGRKVRLTLEILDEDNDA